MMMWFSFDNNRNDAASASASASTSTLKTHLPHEDHSLRDAFPTLICPSCAHPLHQFQRLQGGFEGGDWGRFPAGVKFDPSDEQIMEHLEAKVKGDKRKLHPLIDEFIPTLEGEDGICYTHPQNLPGMRKDGKMRHFFHRPSKAYTAGTRKRRKVKETEEEEGMETRWHKTGKTRAVVMGGVVIGFKKILVLYSKSKWNPIGKPQNTNWIMHQYHLGTREQEKEGQFVASKVFFQRHPRHCPSRPPLNNDYSINPHHLPGPHPPSVNTDN